MKKTAEELLGSSDLVASKDGFIIKQFKIVYTVLGLRVADSDGCAYKLTQECDVTNRYKEDGILAVAYADDFFTIYKDGRWSGVIDGVEFETV